MKLANRITLVAFAVIGLLQFSADVAQAYYNPQTGRWLSRDPLGESGFQVLQAANASPRVGNPVPLPPGRFISRDPIGKRGGRNLYGFVHNDPISYSDMLGLKCCLITYHASSSPVSIGGHSVLSCDNGAYVSFFPEQNGDPSTQWHTQQQDQQEYGYQTPDTYCFDCLDEQKVQDWLQQAKQTDHWTWGNNCSDATSAAAAAGLPDPQTKPKCPCSSDRFKQWVVEDLLHPDVGVNFPSDTANRFKQMVGNGCNRYQCVLKNAH